MADAISPQAAPTAIDAGKRRSGGAGGLLLLAVVSLLTVAGIVSVLTTRYSVADSYPEYSTLRTDPLGAGAIYEALDRLPNITTERNFQRLDRLKPSEGDALVLLNVDASEFNSPEGLDGEAVRRWLLGGGRVVITLSPRADGGKMAQLIRKAERELDEEEEQEKKKKQATKAKGEAPSKTPDAKAQPVAPAAKEDSKPGAEGKKKARQRVKPQLSLAEVLRLSAKATGTFFAKAKGGSKLQAAPVLPLSQDELPEWYSHAFVSDDPSQDFRADWEAELALARSRREAKKADEEGKADKPEKPSQPPEPSAWKVLARLGDRATIAERRLGTGSVVVCSDTYFMSNEALWKEPKAKFIAWLLGDTKRLIFDEPHLDASGALGDQASIMTLARQHGLQSLFIAGLLLFGLFIWRNATSLVPRDEAADLGYWRAGAVAGQSSASGLEGLLRRGISPRDLLRRCFETWSSTRAASGTVPAKRREEAAALLDSELPAKAKPKAGLVVTLHARLCEVLHRR